jgi:hypothetical protein
MSSIYSLKVKIGAAEYLLSSESLTPLDYLDRRLVHQPLLEPPSFEEALDWGKGSGGVSGASVAFLLPGESLDDLDDDGQPVLDMWAELSKLDLGEGWESRLVLARGKLSVDQMSSSGELIEGSIEPIEAEAAFPRDPEVISGNTFGTDNYLDADEGAFYPRVFGLAGRYIADDGTITTTKASATKLLGADLDGFGRADKGVLAGDWVETGTVSLYSVPELAYVTVAVIEDVDALGQRYSYVDLTAGGGGAPAAWTRDDSMEIYVVNWVNGGSADPNSADLLTGAVAVSRWLLENGGADLDSGSFAEAAAYCDRVWLAGYVDEQVEPESYIAENIQALCPRLYLLPGSNGLRAVALQDPYPQAPLLIMGQNCQPGGSAVEVSDSGGINRYRLNFALRIRTGEYKAHVVCSEVEATNTATAYTDISSPYAGMARSRLQAPVEVVEDTDILYDRDSASISVEEQLYWNWTRARFIPATIHLDEDDARYRLGAYVRLTDEDRNLEEQGSWVVARREEGDAMTLMLAILK